MTAEASGLFCDPVTHDGEGRLAAYATYAASYASVVLETRHTKDVISAAQRPQINRACLPIVIPWRLTQL